MRQKSEAIESRHGSLVVPYSIPVLAGTRSSRIFTGPTRVTKGQIGKRAERLREYDEARLHWCAVVSCRTEGRLGGKSSPNGVIG